MRDLCRSFRESADQLERLSSEISCPSLEHSLVRTKDLCALAAFSAAVGQIRSPALLALACALYQLAVAANGAERALWETAIGNLVSLANGERSGWPASERSAARERAREELAGLSIGETFEKIIHDTLPRACFDQEQTDLADRTKTCLVEWLVAA
jgi:hypothetical protein